MGAVVLIIPCRILKLSMQKDLVWAKVLEVVRVSVSPANFSAWFSNTFVSQTKKSDNGRQIIEVACATTFARDILDRRYFGVLQDAVNQVTGKKNDLVFIVKPQPVKIQTPTPLFVGNEEVSSASLRRTRIPDGFSFSNFAVSPANQLAFAAASSVAKTPGSAYNPLFIWGGVGVGKTHLAAAIAREILEAEPSKKILFATGDDFIVGIIEAIKNKTTGEFKKKYRNVEVLVVDDIGFIAGKDTVQDEFFHTFNQVRREGGQIILTSDRPPWEMPKIEARLRSRFEAGLIVDIAPPDFELRAAILLIKAKERGVELPLESAQKIASTIATARQLEGFLIKLISKTDHQNLMVNDALISELLGESQKNIQNGGVKKHLAPKDVINSVASFFEMPKKVLFSPTRKKTAVLPRHILMYLLRTEAGLAYEEIGRLLGGRDHTTIIHGVDKISKNITIDQDLQKDVLGIKSKLWG